MTSAEWTIFVERHFFPLKFVSIIARSKIEILFLQFLSSDASSKNTRSKITHLHNNTFVSAIQYNTVNDCNWTRTQNYLVHKRKLNHLAKLRSVWSVWPNVRVFVYKLSGSGFEPSCSLLNFRFCTCLEQGVPWHSGNYKVWIHSKTCMWHDKNIQPDSK